MARNHSTDMDDDVEVKIRKVDTVAKRYTCLDYAGPLIEKNMPRNTSRLKRHIGDYHSRYLNALETLYMTSYPFWISGKDDKILFDVTGIDRETMKDLVMNIEKPDYYKVHKYYIDEVEYTICFLLRYYLLKKDKQMAALMCYYFAYSLYWMAWTRSFKKYAPRQEIVEYAINNLSDKFSLRKAGSINKWLFNMIDRIITTQEKGLLGGADYDIYYIIDLARTKIGNSVNGIANQIYDAANSGNMMFTSKTTTADGEVMQSNTETEVAIHLSQKYTQTFFSEPISMKALRVATTGAEIGAGEIRSAISNMKNDSSLYDSIKEFYGAVFGIFLESGKYSADDVRTTQFVACMMNAYKKGNTADNNMLKIRDCLNAWLERGSPLYKALTRAASQSSFRKSIYTYMIYSAAIAE